MTEKEKKAESCSCNGGCCAGKCIIPLIGAIAAIVACVFAIKAYCVSNKAYELNVLSAGGEENLEKMIEMYKSEGYIEYATESTEQYVKQFLDTSDSDDTTDSDSSDTNSGEDYQTLSEENLAYVENLIATTPVRGDKNARFTIIEYTELLCPYCQRHSANGTINTVIDTFPGEVNSVSRYFIIHGEPAVEVSAAMECVAKVNPDLYYDVFEKAFEKASEMSDAGEYLTVDALVEVATSLGIDQSSLQTCINDEDFTDSINEMMNIGSEVFGINGTPGNVIVDRQTGKWTSIAGAYPSDDFINTINSMRE